MGETSFFDWSKLNALFLGLGFILLSLLAIQLWGAVVHYHSGLRFGWLLIISLLGIIMGIVEYKLITNNRRIPKSLRWFTLGLLLLVTFLVERDTSLLLRGLSLAIMVVIYHLAYGLSGVVEKFKFDKTQYTGVNKNYEWNLAGYNHLKKIVIKIDLLLIGSWLFIQEISKGLLLLGAAVFLLQFIVLGIGFYLKKRIAWQLENRSLQPNVFTRMIGGLLIIAVLISVIAGILPVRFDNFWQAVSNKTESFIEQASVMPTTGELNLGNQAGGIQGSQRRKANNEGTVHWYDILLAVIITLGYIITALAIIILFLTLFWKLVLQKETQMIKNLPQIMVKFYRRLVDLVKNWQQLFSRGIKQITTSWQERDQVEDKTQSFSRQQETDLTQLNLDPDQPRDKIILLFLQAKESFSEAGIQLRKNETLAEYLQKVSQEFSTYRSQVFAIQRLLSEAVYSSHQLTERNAEQMKAAVDKITRKKRK